jgi:hypothetical protein
MNEHQYDDLLEFGLVVVFGRHAVELGSCRVVRAGPGVDSGS